MLKNSPILLITLKENSMNIKNTLVGMLLIMLSTAVVTQCSEGKMQEKKAEEAKALKPGRGLGMGPLGLRARAMAAEAAAKEEEEAAVEKGKVAPSKVKQAPPLPPKRAKRTAEAQAAPTAEEVEHEESWGEMMSRHAATLASHLGME